MMKELKSITKDQYQHLCMPFIEQLVTQGTAQSTLREVANNALSTGYTKIYKYLEEFIK